MIEQSDHGPAEPHAVNVYNYPDEDLFAVQASEPDRLPPFGDPVEELYRPDFLTVRDVEAMRAMQPASNTGKLLPTRGPDGGKPDCHSLTCVACGNPTNMADFAPHTATCRACAAAERRLNEAVAPNWSGEP